MQTHTSRSRSASSNPDIGRDGVLVLDGYGLKVAVERGHLVYSDGFGRQRRTGRVSRATGRLKRLVVVGHTGYVTFEALRWLHAVGATFAHIDSDGTVFQVSAPRGRNDARVRRAQALASADNRHVAIARDLVFRKVQQQADLLEIEFSASGPATALRAVADTLTLCSTVPELITAEGLAAKAYWDVWSEQVVTRFTKRDERSVPDHWKSFDGRSSLLTRSPRRAVNPVNALLNYGYALAEVESAIALEAVGLDSGMGVLHADQEARESLALDLLEVVRTDIDRAVLQLVRTRAFTARHFVETNSGECRLAKPLPAELASMLDGLRGSVAPYAEQLLREFVGARSSVRRTLPTPLTERNRMGRGAAPQRVVASVTARLGTHCEDCGVRIPDKRRLCLSCANRRREARHPALMKAGPAALAQLRAEGHDPMDDPSNREKMRAKYRARVLAEKDWEASHAERPSPEEFRDRVWPTLQKLTLPQMARATGLSERQCWRIRRGDAIPHWRHWDALNSLAG